jgi:hypothetical protein
MNFPYYGNAEMILVPRSPGILGEVLVNRKEAESGLAAGETRVN